MNSSWKGSTDPKILSGTATFDGVEIKLNSFNDYRLIDILLQDARFQGKLAAANQFRDSMQQAIDAISVSRSPCT